VTWWLKAKEKTLMKKLITICAVMMVLIVSGTANAVTVNFTAADIVSAIGGLNDASNQWGLWAVRARPVVTGGGFTITSGSTTQTGWGVDAPSSYSWSGYGTNCVWFWDASGAEVPGNPPNPLYMIMDRPEDTFTSYFGNIVTKVADSTSFSFSFTLGSGATWNGQWQFLVDGSKYTLGESKGTWVEDFFGNYGSGGGLSGNMGDGYTVPEPATICLLGLGALSLLRRKR
jgi:hypothetical protein